MRPPRAVRLAGLASLFLCAAAAFAIVAKPSRAPSPAAAGSPSPLLPAFRGGEGVWTAGGDHYAVRASTEAFEVAPLADARAKNTAARPSQVRIETTDVTRGSRSLGGAASSAKPAVDADGELIIDRGEIAQHLRPRPEGVELSYSFPARPEGEGDVTVRLRVSGQAYAGEGAGGHRFADRETGLGVRVGHATWIDARGARADVPVRAVPGGLEMRVAANLVETSAYPAVLDPLISPETGTDDPLFGPAAFAEHSTSLAFDGTQHLAVWYDGRGAPETIYGARIMPNGTVLDTYGLGLATGTEPRVAAGGGVFLVAFLSGEELKAVRVNPSGAVLDATPITIGGVGGAGQGFAVTYSAGHFVVAWVSTENPAGLRHARITPAGVVLDPGGIASISGMSWMFSGLGLASGGTDTLMVWHSNGKLRGARIDAQGALLDPSGVDLAPTVAGGATGDEFISAPAVVFDGTNYLVAWETAWTQREFQTLRVSPAAVPFGVPNLLAVGDSINDEIIRVALVKTPSGFLMTSGSRWELESVKAGGTLRLLRLDPLGAFLDAKPSILTTSGRDAAIASDGTNAFFAWSAFTGNKYGADDFANIVGSRFAAGGAQIDTPPIVISTSGNTQTDVSIAWNGQNYLVAWEDDRDYVAGRPMDIVATRVSPAGQALDTSGLPMATGPLEQRDPRVISDGQSTLLVWSAFDLQSGALEEQDSLRAARVNGQGVLIDNPPLQLGSYQLVAGTQFAGNTLLVLQYAFGGLFSARIPFRINAQGNVVALPGELPWGFSGALASDGVKSLYVWGADMGGNGFGDPTILRASRLDANATMLDPAFITIANQNELLCGISAAFGGGVYLVTWRAFDLATKVTRERAARVTPDGMVLDSQGLMLDAHPDPNGFNGCRFSRWDQRPAVAFDGSHFVVARFAPGADPRFDHIRGVTVAPDGTVGTPFDISTEPGIIKPVEIASRGDGETMVAFSRFVAGAPYESIRVRLTRNTSCDTCPSGFCSDGVCCDTACGDGDTTDCMACSVAAGAPVDGVCAPLDGTTCGDGTDVCSAGTCMEPVDPPDAGTDAGEEPDAGMEMDAGEEPDAGMEMDAGEEPDAGMGMDAGEEPDAGMDPGGESDAGTGADAGPGEGPGTGGGDCSCRVGDAGRGPSSPLLLLGALGVFLSVKRRAGGARRSHHTG
ncbi:hypothetical protein [Polyangium aurulentum]|uniref:hypothetical protein n=1 Tax=Polyangium aurulentum TaxID=2567896 RepID=UPI0010ADF8D0|nr:hypothetical protein [Polyangium aurulentum]UQA64061.1 hypothetical protein E8A73_032290 [Polyangium aurulentum]